MQILFYISLFAGILLYVTKLISFYAFMSPFPRAMAWLKGSPFRLAFIDVVFGFLGMHVISIAAGSVSAMFIMIVFGTCSILYLTFMTGVIKYKQRKLNLARSTV